MVNKLKLTQEEYDGLVELLNNHDLDMFDILNKIRYNWDNKFSKLYLNLFGNITTELDREVQIEFIKDPLSYVEVEKKKYYVHLLKDDKEEKCFEYDIEDKVVLEIKGRGLSDGEEIYRLDSTDFSWLPKSSILGKLEDIK